MNTNTPLIDPPTQGKAKFAFRKYQVEDLARAAMHDGLVFSWDPGLGKTMALFVWSMLKGARRVLIVAPEQLHEQICDEARQRLGLQVRPLLSVADFHADKLLTRSALEARSGLEITAQGWWVTSYSALGYNGGDMWEPKETDAGHVLFNRTILHRRQCHPLYREELDYGIGRFEPAEIKLSSLSEKQAARQVAKAREQQGAPRCIFYPNLALLVADLFDGVACDEGVRLKADESYTSLGVRTLRPRYRIVLTGTPIKNRLEDIFWLCQWATGGHAEATARWPYENTNKAKSHFADEHMLIERNHTREAEHIKFTGQHKIFERRTNKICNIHRLWKLFGPVVLRRRKDMIGEEIVSKTVIPVRVTPGTAQQVVYKFHVDHKPQIGKNGEPLNPIARVMAQLQLLRQAALCPDSPKLSPVGISMMGLRFIIRQAQKNPKADEKLTNKATLVARKGVATPFPAEAEVAFALIDKMAASGKLDLARIIEAAPSLEERLRPFIIAPDVKTQSRSWTDHNPKQAAILKLIQQIIPKGEQVIIMSPFQDFSVTLYRRLLAAGVSCCLLDGSISPRKRGAIAKQFKRHRQAVMVAGTKAMGEGNDFPQCCHLILPSLEWALDNNNQAVERIHRINSLNPVKIYAMITTNSIDERLFNVWHEKKDSANLALDGALFADRTDELNLAELLAEAIRNFDPAAPTIPEQNIEDEWEGSLKEQLRIASAQFHEWHPPIVPDTSGYRTTRREVAAAVASVASPVKSSPVVALVKCVPSATLAALIESADRLEIERVRSEFIQYCEAHPEYADWRIAWKQFRGAPRMPSSFILESPAAPSPALRHPSSLAPLHPSSFILHPSLEPTPPRNYSVPHPSSLAPLHPSSFILHPSMEPTPPRNYSVPPPPPPPPRKAKMSAEEARKFIDEL